MCPWRGGGQRTQPRRRPHCLHPRSWPRSSAGKFSQGPRGTRVGTGAGFYGRKETKSSIPGSPGSRRQGAPVPQAASRTAALGSEALGGGRTIQAARTARPPAPHRSPRSRHWGARSRRGGRRVVPALGQPPPRALADPRQGRRVGPDCRSVYLRGADDATRGGGEASGRGEGTSAGAKISVAPGRCGQSRGGGRAPYLGEPRESSGGRRLCLGLRGARSLRVHSPYPVRAPPGWRTLVVRGTHPLRRPLAGGLGLGAGRTPRGAHPPWPLRD